MKSVVLTLLAVVLGAALVLVAGKGKTGSEAPRSALVGSPAPAAPTPRVAAPSVPPRGVEPPAGAVIVVEAPSVAANDNSPASVRSPAVDNAQPAARAPAPMAGWGPPPAPELDPRPFSEAHWQGLELIPKTPGLAQTLRLPEATEGVIVDDVSMPADLQGFRAGDLVTSIGGAPTANLTAFVRAADQVREQRQIEIEVWRAGGVQRLVLTALFEHLGTANGETATMITPGARSPHQYQGACTSCHRIGTTGSLLMDQGDTPSNAPPAVQLTSTPPHRDRGPCSTCHKIVP